MTPRQKQLKIQGKIKSSKFCRKVGRQTVKFVCVSLKRKKRLSFIPPSRLNLFYDAFIHLDKLFLAFGTNQLMPVCWCCSAD